MVSGRPSTGERNCQVSLEEHKRRERAQAIGLFQLSADLPSPG
jgi:hypothetical protein